LGSAVFDLCAIISPSVELSLWDRHRIQQFRGHAVLFFTVPASTIN
jgi:hypothetical protein